MTQKTVKPAMYYNYEGASLLATKDGVGGIELEVYDMNRGELGKCPLSMFISMTEEDFTAFAKGVMEL